MIDSEVIASFLSSYEKRSPHTRRLYEREITVFIYWLRVFHEDNPIKPSTKLSLLQEVEEDELQRYWNFITHSFGFEDIANKSGVSEPSAEVVFKILALLLDWVYRAVGRPPSLGNPARAVLAAVRAKREPQHVVSRPESFSSVEWKAIEELLQRDFGPDPTQAARERWVVNLLFHACLRRDEAARLTMGDFVVDGKGVATLRVGTTSIPVSASLIDELAVYRTALGLARNGREEDQSPVIQSVRCPGLAVTPQTILRLVQSAFSRVADQLPDSFAIRARKATPQTIRNTALRVAVEEGEDARSIAARMRCSLGWVRKAEETYRLRSR